MGLASSDTGAARSASAGDPAVPLQMGTLSKAIGGYGGYLCASKPVIDLIKTRARTLIYSTALPPAMAGAAIAALDIIESEPGLVEKPLARARAFTAALGLPQAQSAIVAVIIGAPEAALEASRKLAQQGFLVDRHQAADRAARHGAAALRLHRAA